MKKCGSIIILFLFISCGSNRDQDKLKVFLTEWSEAISSKDESARSFYVNQFVFPKVIFSATEGVQFNLTVEQAEIASEENGHWKVNLPFQVTGPDGIDAEQGTIILTITKTEHGFLISDMTQDLALKIKEQSLRLQASKETPSQQSLRYDSMLSAIRVTALSLSKHYDTVVFFTEFDNKLLFYVANGIWEYPYSYKPEEQRDGGNYKMGVVTAENKLIIPVAYSKIYNPYGSFPEMIEVETNGLRGLYTIDGKAFIPAEFNGIYPSHVPGVFAQVKKGDRYGWVDKNGNVSFDPSSHENKKLFLSPIENNAILNWEFNYPGPVKVLINPYGDTEEITGVIVYPSFVRDLGITSIANPDVMLEMSEFGMGMTDTAIRFEKVESISDKLFGLISFFMEAGADARGYHSTQNDLLVVDKSLNKVGHQERLTLDYFDQDPCGERHPVYKTLEPWLFESQDGHGVYNYYKVLADGNVEQLKTVRQYPFTKFALMDEGYLNHCRYEGLEYRDDGSDRVNPNVVVINGISSEELDIMRNEIFAEYGFIFKSPRWKQYFEAKLWYKPQYENVDQFLTEIDKHNIKFILDYQRLHQGQKAKRDSIQFYWAG